MKSWRKSLRRAIRQWSNSNAARWPEVYRRLLTVEITALVRQLAPRLTGPVVKIGTHLYPAPAGYKIVPLKGLGGGTAALCRI
jgi:hypothetical protein